MSYCSGFDANAEMHIQQFAVEWVQKVRRMCADERAIWRRPQRRFDGIYHGIRAVSDNAQSDSRSGTIQRDYSEAKRDAGHQDFHLTTDVICAFRRFALDILTDQP
jgi:hypothetical protein